MAVRSCSTHIFSAFIGYEDFPCFLKKGPTLSQRVRFVFRSITYWRVKVKTEKIDQLISFDRTADGYRREAPIAVGLIMQLCQGFTTKLLNNQANAVVSNNQNPDFYSHLPLKKLFES
jgi:hypothetical protein